MSLETQFAHCKLSLKFKQATIEMYNVIAGSLEAAYWFFSGGVNILGIGEGGTFGTFMLMRYCFSAL